MESPIKIKLKEETPLALDGVNSKTYKKGKVLTSASTLQRRLFNHLVEAGKAEIGFEEKSDSKEGKKVSKPKETKSKSKKKSSSKKSED